MIHTYCPQEIVGRRAPTYESLLQPGDIIYTDFAAVFEGRYANLSRFAVVGSPSADQISIYKNLREIELSIFEFMRPGIAAHRVFEFYIEQLKLRGFPTPMPLLGHGIGIDAHEEPMIVQGGTGLVDTGMVLVIEPQLHKACELHQIQDEILILDEQAIILSDEFETGELFVIN